MPIARIQLSRIRRDGGTQNRAVMDGEAIRDYAHAARAGAKFPPVRVFFDGKDYWLSDGFHRTEAHERAGLAEIDADVISGTLRDAIYDSFSANKTNGVRRTGADIVRALWTIFADDEWKRMSQRKIAELVGCKKSWVHEQLEKYRRATGQDGPRAGPEPANKRNRSVPIPARARAAPPLTTDGDPSCRIIHASALRSGLPSRSVHTCITSPPFWGHRDYATDPEVWGGDPACNHVWDDVSYIRKGSTNGRADAGSTLRGAGSGKVLTPGLANDLGAWKDRRTVPNAKCLRCGAFSCELGQEPTPDMYVEHLVQVFREVKRVLRDDGVLWVNLGDTYCTETRGAGGAGKQHSNRGSVLADRRRHRPDGMKPKDLTGIPFMFAFAMRDYGWFWRSTAPWVKASAMPDPAKDRPGVAVEYWMMFSKASAYFYDADAVRLPPAPQRPGEVQLDQADAGRNRRNCDWWFESVAALADRGTRRLGMITNEDGMPVGFDFANPGFAGDHHATFPVPMIVPIVSCATSAGGCCAHCGAPYRRLEGASATACPWVQDCGCNGPRTVPCTVYDPFTGAASTAIAALTLGRRFVGTEINGDYVLQGHRRVAEWREQQQIRQAS